MFFFFLSVLHFFYSGKEKFLPHKDYFYPDKDYKKEKNLDQKKEKHASSYLIIKLTD